jgi:hypothetical protein
MSDFIRSTFVFRELDAAALRELEAVLRASQAAKSESRLPKGDRCDG